MDFYIVRCGNCGEDMHLPGNVPYGLCSKCYTTQDKRKEEKMKTGYNRPKMIYRCDCGQEGIVVSNMDEFGLQIAVYQMGFDSVHLKRSIWERLRWCWHIIWHGDIWNDQVIMNPDDADLLADEIKKQARYCRAYWPLKRMLEDK